MAGEWSEKESLKQCICERCPTYLDCSRHGTKKEKAFCFPTIGKSGCISKEKGCICGACQVHRKMNLANYYFCIKGSEEQQNRQKRKT